jgi:hypothetical protein
LVDRVTALLAIVYADPIVVPKSFLENLKNSVAAMRYMRLTLLLPGIRINQL